mmetsp:Transcript_33601/g.36185  ORF Transcript_33601/g.36185 Transcript_33601/m.36185 type:complete len:154 (+) Transcript_33601:486-947(+)
MQKEYRSTQFDFGDSDYSRIIEKSNHNNIYNNGNNQDNNLKKKKMRFVTRTVIVIGTTNFSSSFIDYKKRIQPHCTTNVPPIHYTTKENITRRMLGSRDRETEYKHKHINSSSNSDNNNDSNSDSNSDNNKNSNSNNNSNSNSSICRKIRRRE